MNNDTTSPAADHPVLPQPWRPVGETKSYSYMVRLVDDTYKLGAHDVPRKGLLLVLVQRATEKLKEFYLAGRDDPDRAIRHFDTLTDDLLSQWFKEPEKKVKKEKVVEEPKDNSRRIRDLKKEFKKDRSLQEHVLIFTELFMLLDGLNDGQKRVLLQLENYAKQVAIKEVNHTYENKS